MISNSETYHMLFIKVKLNFIPVNALIDTGTFTSIVSLEFAKKCNIDSKINFEHFGLGKGFGYMSLMGKIFNVNLEIENETFIDDVFVSEDLPVDLLLGIDFIRKYQCEIDMKNNLLRFGINGMYTNFLDADVIPKYFQSSTSSEQLRQLRIIKELQRTHRTKYHKASSINRKKNNLGVNKYESQIKIKSKNINLDEKIIGMLCSAGFKRNDVVKQLKKHDNNVYDTIKELTKNTRKLPKMNATNRNQIEFRTKSNVRTDKSYISGINLKKDIERNKINANKNMKMADYKIADRFTEDSIESLKKYGFSETDVIRTLKLNSGVLDKTIRALINKQFRILGS